VRAFLAFGGQDVTVKRAFALRHRRKAWSARVCTAWLGWLELAMVNCRSGPKWASTGFAHEA
jgi:hypothetical protein